MANSQEVSARVSKSAAATTQALGAQNPELYEEVDLLLRQLETAAREAFQAKLAHDYQAIIKKLESGRSLTAQDHEILELLIVGEAKYYLKNEDDLKAWKEELERVTGEIEAVSTGDLESIDNLLNIQALCRDARGVLPNITLYYREKARIERFENATAGEIDVESGKILADVIRGMMTSEKM